MPGQAVGISAEARDAAASDVKNFAEPSAESRPQFARLSRDPQRAVKQMAARIKFLIEFFSEDGTSLRMQEIKPQMHAYRYLEFDEAIKFLEKRKQIVIRLVQPQGRVFRVILRPDRRTRLPDPFVFRRKKRYKRKRPPTDWFLERRHLMDKGQHSGFANGNPGMKAPIGMKKSGKK